MVVRNLSLAILPNIEKGISARDLITSGSHGELINPCVLTPIVTDGDVAFQDFTLWPVNIIEVDCSAKEKIMHQYHYI